MLTICTKLSLVLLILFVVGSLFLGSAQAQDPSPKSREITKEELDRRFHLARQLAEEGKFEQALNEYLFVFDNSRGVTGYGGVRLSYIPDEIAAIGQRYKPALVALKTRRDEREKLVLAGKADFDVIHELASITQYLNEPERNVALFDKVKTMGPAYKEIREDLLTLIWEQLVEAKRYSDLKDKVDELAKQVASHIAEFAINNDFPDKSATSSPEYQTFYAIASLKMGARCMKRYLRWV